MMALHSTHVFSMKKVDNSVNYESGGIINCWTHHNSLCRDKNKYQMTSYGMVYKAMSHVMLPHIQEFTPSYITCLKYTEVTFQVALIHKGNQLGILMQPKVSAARAGKGILKSITINLTVKYTFASRST
jgi:hypothetical protein